MHLNHSLRLMFVAMSLFTLAACSNTGVKTEETASIPQQPQSNVVYTLPGTDFSQYTNIVFTPLNTDNVKIIPPADTRMKKQEWVLDSEDVKSMQRMYAEGVTDEITKKGRFTNIAGQTEQTLIIDTELLSLFPTAPKDDLKTRPARSRYYTDGAGSMTVMFTAKDAQTNDVVARFVETHADSGRMLNNRINNRAAMQQAFRRWGFEIRQGLIELSEPTQ
ncbi:MAG: hypothetical protein AseanaTS_16570 [Candidatus Pelagadaptatus aseana]|uniref:DUF3313 family protein n=1 Tax=Candidatus Pelagadaptatus aseana TaxID=3120508 RepID=UPI0039B34F41